jgi:hypothetical protein
MKFVMQSLRTIQSIDISLFYETNYSREGTNVLRFWLYRNSVEAILVIMFIAGTARADVLSLGYVAFSLYFLWNSEYLLQKRNSG